MSAPLTIEETILVADLSSGLAANDNNKGSLFSPRQSYTSPNIIQIVNDALRWHNDSFPTIDGVSAIGYIEIDTIGRVGDTIEIIVTDVYLGTVSLGVYTQQITDTTTNKLAQSICAQMNGSNNFELAIVSPHSNIIKITAPVYLGSSINGGNNLQVVITTSLLLYNNTDYLLINSTDKILI